MKRRIMKNILLLMSVLSALLFWVLRLPALPFGVLLKWLALAGLIALVWQQRQSWQETLFVAALCFHSAGDVLLELDRANFFLPAVGAFMIGHLLYLITFWPDLAAFEAMPAAKKILLGAIVLYGAAMAMLIVPHLPKNMLVAVTLYMGVILVMALVVTCANYRNPWLILGAILYVISDSLIALNMFVRPLGPGAHLIWPLYYAGQLLLVTGFVRRFAPAKAFVIS
jgi:uncharacterized membrane protein YhhN